jgi:STE24 endopeptidase
VTGDAERAAVYHRWQFRLAAASLLVTLGCLLAIVLGDLARLRPSADLPRWLDVAALALLVGAALRLLTLPLEWLRGYWLPQRFGLLRQPFRAWCWDRVKAALLGGALALAALQVIYALVAVTTWWWLWAALALLLGSVLLTVVVPVWVIPLFYRLTPLEDEALRERLLGLARQAGVPVLGVWVADQSRRSRTANAALTGLGRTRRIVLFDTLLAEFPHEEIEAVLAHELAHHVHGDMRRGLLLQGAVLLAGFWAADRLLQAQSARLGLAGPADPAGLPLLALILLLVGLVAAPLVNGLSRWRERRADDFALGATGKPGALIAAFERLALLNLAERHPHPVKEFLLYSHPSIGRRIARARAFRSKEATT